MNRFIQMCLGALAVMVSAGSSGEVQAKEAPRFNRIAGLATRAAAADDNTVYALDMAESKSGSGRRIRTFDTVARQWKPRSPADGFGTSLAVDATLHQLYTVSLDNHVWRKAAGATSWVAFPRTNCAGGDLVPRQELGENNVSASNGNVYVLSSVSSVYTWNGACWFKLPALPIGFAVEIAQAAQNPNQVWVINGARDIFHWDGSRWIRMASGIARGVANARIIGNDGVSLWQWSQLTGFTPISEWTFGPISQVQRSANANGYTVVQTGGELWWYGSLGE